MSMISAKSTLEGYLKDGVDLTQRRISFGSSDISAEIESFTYSNVQVALRAIDKMLDVSNKPITIEMLSFGGEVYSMLALIDKILTSPCKFIFKGYGAVMSAATAVMAVCDERYLSKNTMIMIHDGSSIHDGKVTDILIEIEEVDRLQKFLEKLYADNSYLNKEFWATICRRDLYLTADEAIKLGLADGIIPERKRGSFRNGIRKKTFSNVPTEKELTHSISKVFKRIKLEVPKKLSIDIKKEQFENIEEYDYSESIETSEQIKK